MPTNVYEYRKQPDGSTKEVLVGTIPDPIPQEPPLSALTLRELVDAMVAAGGLTQARADAIVNRLKR
jgi:hypothetical protein